MRLEPEEKNLKEYLTNKKKLQEKRPFQGKMELEEFSRKYWQNGEAPYQYHTMEIEDGRTEKEQLIINNVRALKNSNVMLRRMMLEKMQEKQEQIEKNKKHIRLLLAAAMIYGAVTAVQVQQNHPKIRIHGFFRRILTHGRQT